MKRKLSRLLVLSLVVSVFFACALSAQAEKKTYVLKFNHVLTAQDPPYRVPKWAEAVTERTDGGLTIEVFPSAQLGVEEDILEQIRQGANVGQNTDAARLGMYVPDMAVMNAPYFVETLEEVEKLNTLPTVQKWKKELEETQGFKVISFFWVQGFRQMVTSKPIKTPADLAGLRIRTPGAPIWQESVRALGAVPVAMNYGDMYSGLQTKAIDGLELSFTATKTGKFSEVTTHVNETKHILLINFEVISSKWFNALPEEYPVILEEECNKAGLEVSRQYLEEIDPESLNTLMEQGMQYVPSSDIDMEAFKKAGEAAYEKLGLIEARDQIYGELGK